MNILILLFATILMWIAVVAGIYQRIFEMPKWFANPPASFELIRKQSKRSRAFWVPLSILFMVSIVAALFLNWNYLTVRNYIFASLACYILTGILSGIYFVKEITAFTKIPVDAPQTPELIGRVEFWLRWTSIRDILQAFAALFVLSAYCHLP